MPLDELPLHHRAAISAVSPIGSLVRMAELGLRPGAEVVCLQRCAGGGRVVQVGNARLALDRRALRAIRVHAPL